MAVAEQLADQLVAADYETRAEKLAIAEKLVEGPPKVDTKDLNLETTKVMDDGSRTRGSSMVDRIVARVPTSGKANHSISHLLSKGHSVVSITTTQPSVISEESGIEKLEELRPTPTGKKAIERHKACDRRVSRHDAYSALVTFA